MTSIAKSNSYLVPVIVSFLLGAVLMFSLFWMDVLPCICATPEPKNDYVIAPEDGRELSDPEANDMATRFKSTYLTPEQMTIEGSQGGTLSKNMLLELINRAPLADSFINYSFGITDAPVGAIAAAVPNKRVCLVMYTGKLINRVNSNGLIISNGFNADCFCPTRCNDN